MSSLLGSGLTIEPYVIKSGAVAQFLHARLLGAVIAAEHPAALLQAVADDAHAATRPSGRECMDRAFEAVERMGLASRHDLKGFVVVVSAPVAFSHGELLFERLPVAGITIFSGRVAVCALARRWRRDFRTFDGKIAHRHDADQPLVAIHDRQTPHLALAHGVAEPGLGAQRYDVRRDGERAGRIR